MEIIKHPSSSVEHFAKMKEGLETMISHPLGVGLGASGPAAQWSLGVDVANVTESSYLQVGVETGILGFLLFIIAIIGIIKGLYHKIKEFENGFSKGASFGLFLSLIALSICAAFLHSFTDSATTLTLFVLIGIIMSLNNNYVTANEAPACR